MKDAVFLFVFVPEGELRRKRDYPGVLWLKNINRWGFYQDITGIFMRLPWRVWMLLW